MNYKEQSNRIEELCNQIKKASKEFAKKEENPYYGDLGWVIGELEDITELIVKK